MKYVAALGVFWFLGASSVFAHPHVTIDSTVTLAFDLAGPTAVEVVWHFDSSFSQTVLQDVGRGADGKFPAKTQIAIKKGYFDNLLNYGYFTRLTWNGQAMDIKPITDFSASLAGERLAYQFRIPLSGPSKPATRNTLTISFFDDSFFIAFNPMKASDLAVTGQAPPDIKRELVDRKTPTQGWGNQIKQESRFSY